MNESIARSGAHFASVGQVSDSVQLPDSDDRKSWKSAERILPKSELLSPKCPISIITREK